MSTPPARRTRKRLATRTSISDVATRLFFERGFDRVTVDEIAEAADVSRMTVFNHFPRKEDMFFDLDAEGREELIQALHTRDSKLSPIDALRAFAHHAVAKRRPYVEFCDQSQLFIETIEASETLKARARTIRDELVREVSVAMAESVGRAPGDADAHLVAGIQVATWGVAMLEAHKTYQKTRKNAAAHKVLLAIVDKGAIGLATMMAGTPYAND
ncbi:TetR/AcrR family transcriptional regulator [Rhodanobacter sp. A1T4]|uniref:TetR/AcrR family transcriptional regulator n=1 Tax=Rhodanobacter sp. A1T4 TaxID=2723087 RepID=UPI0016150D20|nr:TetR/AcrR family transcriptional regulator [Rhodanobacter sp. A1T4]MBB6247761.1 AcrR family transcriptional regulator [Rhodanobacter sp. A1T4]